MRISDWSSDVCSSDLTTSTTTCAASVLRVSLGRCAISSVAPYCGRPADSTGGRRLTCRLGLSGKGYGRGGALPASRAVTPALRERPAPADRTSVVSGQSVSVRVDLGGRRIIKKKKKPAAQPHNTTHTT